MDNIVDTYDLGTVSNAINVLISYCVDKNDKHDEFFDERCVGECYELDKKIMINKLICKNLRINISSVIPNYLSSC